MAAPSPAEQLASQLAFSFDNALRLVQAFIDDPKYGDVPQATIEALLRRCANGAEARRLLERITQLRQAR